MQPNDKHSSKRRRIRAPNVYVFYKKYLWKQIAADSAASGRILRTLLKRRPWKPTSILQLKLASIKMPSANFKPTKQINQDGVTNKMYHTTMIAGSTSHAVYKEMHENINE